MKDKTISYIEVWDLLTDFQSLMNVLGRKIQNRFDLTPQELRVMIELDKTRNMNISQLSKAINRDFGNVSRTCSTLVRKGLLTRKRDHEDHRITMVALTSKGKEKLDLFYKYNLTIMQSNVLEENLNRYEAMILGMRLFLTYVADRMEELDD